MNENESLTYPVLLERGLILKERDALPELLFPFILFGAALKLLNWHATRRIIISHQDIDALKTSYGAHFPQTSPHLSRPDYEKTLFSV